MRERVGGGILYKKKKKKEILLLEKKARSIKCDVVNWDSMIFSVCKIKNLDMKENMLSQATSALRMPAPEIPGNPVNRARRPDSADNPKPGGASKKGSATAIDKVTLQTLSLGPLVGNLEENFQHDWD